MSGVWRETCMTRDNPPLITNTPSPVFLQQPSLIIWSDFLELPPNHIVKEIDPAQLET